MIEIKQILQIAEGAGQKVMEVYQQDFSSWRKADASPVTEADLIAHQYILEKLQTLTPQIPVLSEESKLSIQQQAQKAERLWMVDPIDGTKEFIKKNGEFTVNIALIERGVSRMGVVHAPALKTSYWGEIGREAFKKTSNGEIQNLAVIGKDLNESWKVLSSRSHPSENFKAFIERIQPAEVIPMGSSLKMCFIAEGKAHFYARFGPTSEWDTAAAQAVLEAAGGKLLALPDLGPLKYQKDKESFLNPKFIAAGNIDTNQLSLLLSHS